MTKLRIQRCQKCNEQMVVRQGPYGLFWACPNGRPYHKPLEKHPTLKIYESISADDFDNMEYELDALFEFNGYGNGD